MSGAEDVVVRIWRWSKETTSLEMVGQHSVGKGRVTGAELLKGRILGSRIPDIFEENSGHFCIFTINFVGIFGNSQKIIDLSVQMDSMSPD